MLTLCGCVVFGLVPSILKAKGNARKFKYMFIFAVNVYSNKKDTSDFHGTVSFDPIKMSQQKIYQNVNQTSDTQKMVII